MRVALLVPWVYASPECNLVVIREGIKEAAAQHGEPDQIAAVLANLESDAGVLQYCCLFRLCGKYVDNGDYEACCLSRVIDAIEDPASVPQWVVSEVAESLAPWRSVTRAGLERAESELEAAGEPYCRIRVVEGVLESCDPAGSASGNDDAFLNALNVLGRLGGVPERLDLLLHMEDVTYLAEASAPFFVKQKQIGTPHLLIPHEFLMDGVVNQRLGADL